MRAIRKSPEYGLLRWQLHLPSYSSKPGDPKALEEYLLRLDEDDWVRYAGAGDESDKDEMAEWARGMMGKFNR